jgi:hypothetical protein
MGRAGLRLALGIAALLAAAAASSCRNSLAGVVQSDIEQYQATQNLTAPEVDSFTASSDTTYDGTVGFTLSSAHPGNGAASITHWQVNESSTAPLAADAAWSEVASAVSGTYTVSGTHALSDLGTFGDRTLYAWLKNDRGVVSAPGTLTVHYAQYGGPVIDSFTLTSANTTYDGVVSCSLASTHPGDGASAITHWLLTESSVSPLALDTAWASFTTPVSGSYTLANPGSFGTRTIYAWLKNDRQLVSAAASLAVEYSDYGKPTFSVSLTSATPTDDPAIAFSTGNRQAGAGATSIVGWLVNEGDTPPSASDITAGAPPAAFTLALTAGAHTLYVWAKNDHGKLNDPIPLAVTINHRAAHFPTYSFISGHEKLPVTFDVPCGSMSLSGTGVTPMNPKAPVPVDWSDGGKTLSVSSSSVWPQGGGDLIANGTTSYGIPLDEARQSYTVSYAVYVSSPANVQNPGVAGADGDPRHPLDTIQAGINKAKTVYVDAGKGPAEVRVAHCDIANPYTASCTVYHASPAQSAVYVANMTTGVSVRGSYASDFGSRNVAGTPSYIKDISEDAVYSTITDPVRAINASGSGITGSTVLDGFTVTLGAGGSAGTAHCGIACVSGASPTISNVTILGRADAEKSADAYGVFLSGSSATISSCSINPGSSSNQSTGIKAGSGAATPTIQSCTIGGGKSLYTMGVLLGTDVNALVAGCTIVGGDWPVGSGMGMCIYLLTGNSTNADITGNSLGAHSLPQFTTYGIYVSDTTPVSDPHMVRNNTFSYNGNWYCIEKTATVIDSLNYTTVNVPTTGDGTHPLFYTGWGNQFSY